MRIVLAPDSFKHASPSYDAAEAMAEGVYRVASDPQIECRPCPMSDGGEGFCLVMTTGMEAEFVGFELVNGPFVLNGQLVSGILGLREAVGDEPKTAIIELAQASGLERVGSMNPPMPQLFSTRGTGQVIRAALDEGVGRILLGIGGSATIDGGCGIAEALGVVFHGAGAQYGGLDADNEWIGHPMTGGAMEAIERIDMNGLHPRIHDVELLVFNDVTNPLLGPNGAVAVYGPQKGATGVIAERLERGLANMARLWKQQLGKDVIDMPGAGAAGGVGAGLVAMLGATLVPGADTVLDYLGFDDAVTDADLVLTGEGRLDGQSLSGKAVLRVAQRAAKHGVPTIALVGAAADDADRCLDAGLHGYEVLAPGLRTEESIARTTELLADAAERVVRRFAEAKR